MTEKPSTEEGLAQEFQALGKNLMEALRAAWEKPERKRVQEQVLTGLNELGSTLKREADHFTDSSAGQQIKTGVEQVGERLRNAETQEKIRRELLTALQSANAELQKVIERWTIASANTEEGVTVNQEESSAREKKT
jgi:hypothetical protein